MGAGRPSVVKVDRVTAVEILVRRDKRRLRVPQCAFVPGQWQTEVVRVLAESVQVGITGKARSEADVLSLENEWLG